MGKKLATFFGIYFLFSALFASEENEFLAKLINQVRSPYFKRKKNIQFVLEETISVLLTQSTEASRKTFNEKLKDYFLKQKEKDPKKEFFITLFSFINTYKNKQGEKLPNDQIMEWFSNLVFNMPIMQVESIFSVQNPKKEPRSAFVRVIFGDNLEDSGRNIFIASGIVDGLKKRANRNEDTIQSLISQYYLVWLYFFVDLVTKEMQEKKYFKNNVEIHELKKNIEKLIKQPNKEFFEQQVNLYLEKDSTEFFRFLLCQLTRIQLRSGMGNLLFLVNLTAYTSDGSFITVTNPLLDPLQHKNFVDLPSGQFSDVEKIFLSSGLVVGFFDQKIQPELNYYLTILLTLDPKFDSVKLSESLIKNIEKYVENSGLSSVIASYNKFSLLLQAIKPEQKIEFNIASYIMLRNIVEKGIYELTSYEKEWLNDFFALLGQENCGYILLAYINHSFNKEIPVFSHGQFNEAVSTAARIINYVPNAYCLEQAISHADVPELCIIAIGLKDKFDENVELIKQALARLKTIDESLYRELGNSALFSEAQKQVLFPELQRVVVQVEQPLREQLVPLQEQELGHRQIQASAIEELKLSLKKWINSRAIQVLLVTAGLGTLAYFLRKSNRVPIPLWLRWQKH